MLDFGFYNMDCMEGMKQFPDKYFDLAIVDPPYGIGYDVAAEKVAGTQFGKAAAKKKKYHTANWDNQRPDKDYFKELMMVSKNQIIWGGNYYSDLLPPSKSFVCWDKRVNMKSNDFADCELAWCNEELGVARMMRYVWNGMLQEDMKNKETRIHPTQKPVALYKWLLENYANAGDKILDTHVGSGSSLIACHYAHCPFVGFELDPTYYQLASERFARQTAQIALF